MFDLDATIQPTIIPLRENKSPERKVAEILAFGVYNNPWHLREAHTLDRIMLITTAEKADYSMICYGSIDKLGVYLIRQYFSSLNRKLEMTSTMK